VNDIDLDFDRTQRLGFAEVVYGEGKSAEQIREIAHRHVERGANLLVTRCSEAQVAGLPGEYDAVSRTFRHIVHGAEPRPGAVAVVYAGSSDAPVAREAIVTLDFFGCETLEFGDCGVAGRHRLLAHMDAIAGCGVVICCAGFEGALPSVLGGMVGQPVIAVPTSVGYGVAQDGKAALNAMLASCASGITVMNIDNGCGAAMAALRILRILER
jgi:NCAIR mutase (PurE)-related protein